MSISYVTENLLKYSEGILLHGCNAKGVMGSGVAKAIRAKYPIAYEVYHKTFKDDGLDLGDIVYVEINKYLWIANGITQASYGRTGAQFIDYDAINSVMININAFAKKHGIKTVAMPLIGAGLGGGSWTTISGIIEDKLIDVQPIVYLLDGKIPDS